MIFPLRLILPFLIVAFTVLLALYNLQSAKEDVRYYSEVYAQNKLASLITVLRESIHEYQEAHELVYLREHIAALATDTQIVEALIADDDGRIIAGLRRATFGGPITDQILVHNPDPRHLVEDRIEQAKRTLQVTTYLSQDRNHMIGILPFVIDETGRADGRGFLYLQQDLGLERQQGFRLAEEQVARSTALLAAFSIVLVFLSHFIVTRRVNRIIGATRRFSDGDFAARSRVSGRDELGTIGLAFDQMAHQLELDRHILAETNERFRNAFDRAPIGMAMIGLDLRFLAGNPALSRMIGLDSSTLLSTTITELTHHHDVEELRDLFAELLAGASDSRQIEIRLIDHGSHVIITRISAGLVSDEHHKPQYYIVQIIDISGQRTAEAALKRSEEGLAEAQRIARIGNWEWHMSNNALSCSLEMNRILDTAHGPIIDDYEILTRYIHPDDLARFTEAVQTSIELQKIFSIDHRVITGSGEEKFVHTQGEIVRDPLGDPIRMVATTQDITDRRRVESVLQTLAVSPFGQSLNAFIRGCVQQVARAYNVSYAFVAGYHRDNPQTIDTLAIWANDRFINNISFRTAGSPCEDVIAGRQVFLPAHAADKYPNSILLANLDAESYFGIPLLSSDNQALGLIAIMDHHPMQLVSWNEHLLGVFAKRVALEIEHARISEELQRHRSHLEELVTERTNELEAVNHELEAFSYSVSHDLRAPLRGIREFSKALLEDYSDRLDKQGKDYLQRVYSATLRMTDLINDLLTLSRVARSELRFSNVDLGAMVSEIATQLAEATPERNVDIRINAESTCYGDPKLLRILLENLLSNAFKFSRDKDPATIEFNQYQENGETVFYVRDNGAGFSMDYAHNLFVPFQRLHTQTEFEGTGVGLATVQRIIQRHGGRIWATGAAGRGATFYFTIPGG